MQRLFLIRHGKPAAVWGDGEGDPGWPLYKTEAAQEKEEVEAAGAAA